MNICIRTILCAIMLISIFISSQTALAKESDMKNHDERESRNDIQKQHSKNCEEREEHVGLRRGEHDSDEFPTLDQMLFAGKIQPDKWYWMDVMRYVNIDKMVMSEYMPLDTRANARFVTIEHYIEKRIDVWTGYRFEEAIRPDGRKEKRLSRAVYLGHDLDLVHMPERLAKSVDFRARKPGVYFFKHVKDGFVELGYDDLPFLKEYYHIRVYKENDGSVSICVFKNTTKALGYDIYEYYPSGVTKRKVEIEPGSSYDEAPYFIHEMTFQDTYQFPKEEHKSTPLTDHNSPMWIPNILHD